MAKHRSKRYQKAAALVQAGKSYSLTDAISTVKQFPAPKFTPTVTLSFHLGVDPAEERPDGPGFRFPAPRHR